MDESWLMNIEPAIVLGELNPSTHFLKLRYFGRGVEFVGKTPRSCTRTQQ